MRARSLIIKQEEIMEDMKEFIAYSRKLLRTLKEIKKALENKDIEKATERHDE